MHIFLAKQTLTYFFVYFSQKPRHLRQSPIKNLLRDREKLYQVKNLPQC